MTETHDGNSAGVAWDAIHHDQPPLAADNVRDPQAQAAWDRSVAAHHALAARPGVTFQSDETIVIVLHPRFDTLDAIGPHYFLSSMLGATIHLATTGDLDHPVTSAGGLPLTPTIRLTDVPDAPTVLLVPGGDTSVLLTDPQAMSDIQRLGEKAAIVTSVCTGAIALGAAGLLRGRRATSHWSVRHLLTGYGATPVDERVVIDGNVMTAAGVTAGMDLAIRLVARLRGDDYARFLELGAEYAPQPPFGTGTPEKAGKELTALARDFYATIEQDLEAR
ncbi:DJ-1/PfpI family protein [Microbacterium marinilacus]|uniref:DJ-1/PfpI domain-containing protein n=1 Tax=Microbacterium marinilacus TaxID=415209 RepID=A0ABP7BKE0_9MICO|nr:DJ-1/PfpI family protein [Microbacterium marinilacus]MBY0687611.1 DJ-1/PfpI family protein [Microbacterium marinilacus]